MRSERAHQIHSKLIKLPGKASGKGSRARLLGKAAGQGYMHAMAQYAEQLKAW
jgi:hypothetical protein